MCLVTAGNRSPKGVIDFSATIDLDHEEASLKLKVAPMLPLTVQPPPITTEYDGDSTSLSSISFHDNEEHRQDFQEESPSQKRSIFTPYWKKTGEEPFDLKQLNPCLVTLVLNPRSPTRRSIFGQTSEMSDSIRSEPFLMPPPRPILTRKIRSASTLDRPVSILRHTDHEPQRRNSVSFDENDDDVFFFQPPQENWASGGWIHLFSI